MSPDSFAMPSAPAGRATPRAPSGLGHSATIGIAEYNRADTLWHLATDALVAGDYTEFDRLMREFRNISDKWRKK